MKPSTYSSVHSAAEAHSYHTINACYDATQHNPCADYESGLYHDPSCSTEGWSAQSLAPRTWSDGDRALFEAFLPPEVASTSPSGPFIVGPMQPPPSNGQEPFLHHPTEPIERPAGPFNGSLSFLYVTAPSRCPLSPALEHALPEATAPCISPNLICPPSLYDPDLEDDRSGSQSSSCSGGHRSSSSLPFPSPSPEPSPRTSSTIIACHRRNAPARTVVPVSAKTWQCPHCPYVQHNRRSPDLKRHIKTHTRGSDVADWVCCGVPVLNATELGVPAATLREADVFEFDGVLMAGGCRKAFSRRDALIRHLQREKGRCFGDAQSLYQRGNRESR